MEFVQTLIYLVVSFSASVIGAICGIGGGVVIKPVLDLLAVAGVSTISFLSCCTVLSMSCYSVCTSLAKGEKTVDLYLGTPLAIGAAAGGVVGQQLFSLVKASFENPNTVGAVQAGCLLLITLGTLIFTLKKSSITMHHVRNRGVCLVIGLLLGIMSSFLGIGGGPINIAVLMFFCGMDTKTCAANSLYIILFGQITTLATTLITHSVPTFEIPALVLMITGGILGAVMGRKLNRRLDSRDVDRLFIGLMAVIMCICGYNMLQYSVL